MPNALLWDPDLGNVEATPYIELRAASPLPPLSPSFRDLPSRAYIFSGAYTLKTHSLYDLFDLTLTFYPNMGKKSLNKEAQGFEEGTTELSQHFKAHEHVGFFAHFPDTSNTRYQSYCDAAAEIIVHLPVYGEMLEWIRDEKQTGRFTNIELNIYRALNDIPTLTELAAHALYGQAIIYPYLQVARKQGMTHFSLAPLHLNLLDHIQKLIRKPKLLYSPDADYATGSLDGQGWERPEAVYCIMAMAGQLPDLEGVLLFLLEGAFETWKWFSHDVLHREIPAHLLKNLYPPATNDPNESTLGGLRQEKLRGPNASLEYSNSKLMLQRNKGTVDYLENNLSDGLNRTFLQKQQCKTERRGLKLKHRNDLALASQKKVVSNCQKKETQRFKTASKDARIKACTPVTDVVWLHEVLEAVKLSAHSKKAKEIKTSDLDLQLDWHRYREHHCDKPSSIGPVSKLSE
ncbi:hypothetical protein EV359DRAFT_86070 [Lentinula novae-zelandiae]|nr:hypothetical protein EV359DRAFT_86070 [Lentinula novae-zelandiae]